MRDTSLLLTPAIAQGSQHVVDPAGRLSVEVGLLDDREEGRSARRRGSSRLGK
jgi:hypothetical protein